MIELSPPTARCADVRLRPDAHGPAQADALGRRAVRPVADQGGHDAGPFSRVVALPSVAIPTAAC